MSRVKSPKPGVPDVRMTEPLFRQLVQEWHSGTVFTSSLQEMILHPAYLRIIGLGPVVLPLLLREMRDDPDHWFWALRALTGEDPARGDATFDGAVQAWLAWGREHGYLD